MLFKKRNDNVKRCPEGHILDPSWDTCPYCEDDESSRVLEPGAASPSPPDNGLKGISDPIQPSPPQPTPPPPTTFQPPAPQSQPLSPAPPPPPGAIPDAPGPGFGNNDPDDLDDLTVVGYQPAQTQPPPQAPQPTPTEVPEPPATEFGLHLAWLIVVSGDYRNRDFRLTSGAVIVGTGPNCGIRLAGEPFISGRHAEFVLLGQKCHFRDLNSTNGSFVNDNRITEVTLNDGDQIRLGKTLFLFKCLNI